MVQSEDPHVPQGTPLPLAMLPKFVAACGFANTRAGGYEADDFLAAAVALETRRRCTALVASGDS